MGEKTNVFKKFKGSIFNIKSFSKYIKEGLGRAVLYAFLLMLVIGTVKGLIMGFQYKGYIDESISMINDSKYDFTITNGILDIGSEPIKIDEGSRLIYIDDTIDIENSSQLDSLTVHNDEYMLVLRDGVVVNAGGIGKETAYFKEFFQNQTITNEDMIGTLSFVGNITVGIFTLVSIFESIIMYILNSILIAGVSMLTNVMMNLGLKFSEMFSLALYAGTLPIILQLGLTILFPSVYFAYAGTMGTLIYVLIILRSIRKDINEGMHIQ